MITITGQVPQAILNRRMVKRQNAAAAQVLLQQQGFTPAATWEFAEEMGWRFPHFSLEDKEAEGLNHHSPDDVVRNS